jgi:hypothetical protein
MFSAIKIVNSMEVPDHLYYGGSNVSKSNSKGYSRNSYIDEMFVPGMSFFICSLFIS